MIKRIERKFKKISWTKGATFLEFAVVGVMLLSILLIVIGLFIKKFTVERCDMYADAIARDVITCESMEDAVNKANEELTYFDIPFVEEMNVTVGYAVGSETNWKKGNYIVLSFSGKISSVITLTETDYICDVFKMIENNDLTP